MFLSVTINTVDTPLFTFTGIQEVDSMTVLKVRLLEFVVTEMPGALSVLVVGAPGKVKVASTDWPVGA